MTDETDVIAQQLTINASYANRDQWFINFIRGEADGADSFDSDGKPASDPTHGDLGFYPLLNANGETIHRPCMMRLAADGAGGTAFMSIFDADEAPDATITLMNLNGVAGRFAGFTGAYVLAPIVPEGDEVHLTNEASILLQLNGKPAARLFTEIADDGVQVTIGASNAPLAPPGTDEPLDLGGDGIVYALAGEVTSLNIGVGALTGEFDVTFPAELTLVTIDPYRTWTPASVSFAAGSPADPDHPHDGPWYFTGGALESQVRLDINNVDTGHAEWDSDNGGFWIRGDAPVGDPGFGTVGFTSEAFGFAFPASADPLVNHVPHRFRMACTAKITGSYCFMLAIGTYSGGEMRLGLSNYPTVGLQAYINGPNGTRQVAMAWANDHELHEFAAEWRNDESGAGGDVEFFVDGTSIGIVACEVKLRIDATASLTVNNSYGNWSVSTNDWYIRDITFGADIAGTAYSYTALVPGAPITEVELVKLGADGRAVSSPAEYSISYNAVGGPATNLDINFYSGEIVLPAGRAYKAVLEDWRTGAGVAHPHELILTKFTEQNVHFEDSDLFVKMPPWSECISQGPYPSIDGIAYRAEAIRMGTYVQIQFGYGRDVPQEPFGNPVGFNQHPVPHKWLVYDQYGTLIGRIEKPNGSPLNATDEPNIFEGPWNGLNHPLVDETHPFYPHGTVRAGVIWRSHDVVDHDRAFVKATFLPVADDVPYAAHVSYANNGFDLRLSGGNQGGNQMNGFTNWNVMPYSKVSWTEFQAQVAATASPYKSNGIYDLTQCLANSGTWLEYTPFNICGRSPITGPGGGRDDRAPVPNPVLAYILDPAGERLHDGHSKREIARDYLTSYVSEPYHGMENGRFGPLFKDDPFRQITARNHYYGPGQATTSPSNAWYVQGGRTYQVANNTSPLRVFTPDAGDIDTRPYFNVHMIDDLHAHQFPAWGSLLFKTPEFAMMQPSYWDQDKLYNNLLWRDQGVQNHTFRAGAWMFLHAALCWKTGSDRSHRLYSRQQVLDWYLPEIEGFYDTYYASNPGFLNPPTTIANWGGDGYLPDGSGYQQQLIYAMTAKFGACNYFGDGIICQTFMHGYWLTSLAYGKQIGFLDAMAVASPKAGAVHDWLLAMYRKSVCGMVNDLPNYGQPFEAVYDVGIWTPAMITASGGDMTSATGLPQTWAEVGAHFPSPPSPYTWDFYPGLDFTTPPPSDQLNIDRDGDHLDYLFNAPSYLKYAFGMTGADIDAAIATSTARRDAKKAAEEARGDAAGSQFFKFSKKAFQPIRAAGWAA